MPARFATAKIPLNLSTRKESAGKRPAAEGASRARAARRPRNSQAIRICGPPPLKGYPTGYATKRFCCVPCFCILPQPDVFKPERTHRGRLEVSRNLKYAKSDEWSRSMVMLSRSAFPIRAGSAQRHRLYRIIVTPNAEIAAGDAIASVESVKAASDIYSPVAGTVLEINSAVEGSPETLNSDPYEAAARENQGKC